MSSTILKEIPFIRIITFFVILFSFFSVKSQQDTLILINDDIIIGEIKAMDRGILTIETEYSSSDFKIEWKNISEIYSSGYFLLSLYDGTHINGSFRSISNERIVIYGSEGGVIQIPKKDLVFIKEVEKGFWSRLYARVDFGYSLTKANNLEQTTLDSRFGYLEDMWSMDAYANFLFSTQDSIDDIRRGDAGVGYRFHLYKGWYASLDALFLSNTEQALDLRSNFKGGFGRYFFKSNRAYWGAGVGLAANLENFSEDSEQISNDRRSFEGYIGTELNIYDIGDLDFFLNATAYPSITENGRWRFDLRADLKYDLPLDFYIRVGTTVNYDNQPAVEGNETDYVLTNGIGWKW